MNKMLVIALSTAVGVVGAAEGVSPAVAAETTKPTSLDAVRADALAKLYAGDVQTVGKRGRARSRGFRGGRSWRGGRGWRGGRHYGGRRWRGGRRYYGRRYYGRRYYGGRRYYYGRRRGYYGGALAAGVAGLVIGSAIANSGRPAYRGKRWCANRYRSYNWRTGTYLGYDGRRHYCP